ncbi:hypothetical protein ABZ883_34515 [Streptomyces sp. NPDC046977]|uniref:hypothetical protein n=1 Tax=Streptomyces sp. NPDC046977 TaxID=3154703 RepID=UPI0033C89C3F
MSSDDEAGPYKRLSVNFAPPTTFPAIGFGVAASVLDGMTFGGFLSAFAPALVVGGGNALTTRRAEAAGIKVASSLRWPPTRRPLLAVIVYSTYFLITVLVNAVALPVLAWLCGLVGFDTPTTGSIGTTLAAAGTVSLAAVIGDRIPELSLFAERKGNRP